MRRQPPRLARRLSPILTSVAVVACSILASVALATAATPWTDIDESVIAPAAGRMIVPNTYRTLSLDVADLSAALNQAPLERTAEAKTRRITVELPLPEGGSERFAVYESPIMHPDLAARYPEIRTYAGQSLDHPHRMVRFDLTPAGFHAMVLSADGDYFIDPYQRGDGTHHISYYKRHFAPLPENVVAEARVLDADPETKALIAEAVAQQAPAAPTGATLRTYRLAVGATGEYTAFHGGTVPAGMAAIVTAMNRVNGIYERDMALRMELVPNNDLIVYTNSATDPYSNNSGGTMLGQNQSTCDTIIGSANYDIGHAFSTGGGGIASLAVICRTGSKARGVTGLPSPIGDPFYVDYVSHEMGHQYGGQHTFNGNAGACSGGNRNGSTAYEPGSGSTIMAYAGICGSQNIQSLSDDYFHNISYVEIIAYTQSGTGNSCPVTTATGNNEPSVSGGADGYVLPISTPLKLTATGSDADPGDVLTYCWEEWDLGPAGHPNSPSGNAPIFRSRDPDESPSRYLPRLTNILLGTPSWGELLPTYSRNLNFRVTLRDNQAGAGGVDWDQKNMTVSNAAGPFLVTAPNTSIIWAGGTQQTVTWDPANTDVSPVNCSEVNILLSTNGGNAFDHVLATATPNDGSELITVPNAPSVFCRVLIEAVDNVFLDTSDVNFQIEESAGLGEPGATDFAIHRFKLYNATPNPFNPSTMIGFDLPEAGHVKVQIFDAQGRLVSILADQALGVGRHSVVWDGTDDLGRHLPSGVYIYRIETKHGVESRQMTLVK